MPHREAKTLLLILISTFSANTQAEKIRNGICSFDVNIESFKSNPKNDAYSKVFKKLFNDAPKIEKKETDTSQEVLDKINKYMPRMTCNDTIDNPKQYLSYDSSAQKYTYKIKDLSDISEARTNYLVASYVKKIGVGKGYNILHGWLKYNQYNVDNFYISVLNANKQVNSVSFDVPLEKAKRINDSILPIYIYRPLYAKRYAKEIYETARAEHSIKDATVDSREYEEINDYYINAEVVAIWFYDPDNNEIIHKSSPFNYDGKENF